MKMHLRTILLLSLLGGCVGSTPEPTGGGGGSGEGGGGGGGSGGGGGGGNGEGSGGGGGGVTATQFLAQMNEQFCTQAFMCQATFPTDEGVAFADAFGASVTECVSFGEEYDMPAQVEAAITAGKIQFNSSDAAACLAGITFPACTSFWTDDASYPAACDTALVGTVADGGACTVDYECSNLDAYCDGTCTVDTGDTGAREVRRYQASALRMVMHL